MQSDSYINNGAIDRYTSEHFGAGVTAVVLGVPWWATLLGSITWEVLEDKLKDKIPASFPYASHDSLLNASVDTAAVMTGWALGRIALSRTGANERLALHAAVGATLGAFAVRAVSLLGYLRSDDLTRQIRRWDNVSAGVGAAIADVLANRWLVPHRGALLMLGQGVVTGMGATIAGPAGAGAMAYVASAGATAVDRARPG